MAAPAYDFTSPDASHAWDVDLDAIRENDLWALATKLLAAEMIPGWTVTIPDSSEPSTVEAVNGTKKIKLTLTWTSGNPTQIIIQFDRGLGAGYETLAGGTFALTYSASNNLTTVTPS